MLMTNNRHQTQTAPPSLTPRTQLGFAHLTLQSTLADLPTHSYVVTGDTPGQEVAAQFKQQPTLPGVIVVEGDSLIGAFSRRQFLEKVGRLYGVEVYLHRTVRVMAQTIHPNHITLQSDRTILEAANIILRRPAKYFDEPVVLIYPDGTLRLLDTYVIIVAQNHLLNLVTQVEQNRRQLAESLQRIGRELSGSLNLKKVTKRILKELDKVVTYARAVLLLEKDGQLQAIAKQGYPDEIRTAALHILIQDDPNDLYRRMVRTGEPIVITDVQKDAQWQQHSDLPLHHSWLGVPLMHQERVIGMLSLTREAVGAFGGDDITLVLAFAGQAAVALENARLYDEIRLFNSQLEEMVAQRTLELNKAMEILARLDQTKSDFINVMAHELRTPITVISGYSQMLKQSSAGLQDPTVGMVSEGIVGGIERLQRLVNSILDITRLDNDVLNLAVEQVHVGNLIEVVVARLHNDVLDRKQTVSTAVSHTLPLLIADPDLLKKLFHALLINAIKYTPDGGEIEIHGRVVTSTSSTSTSSVGEIEITIRDTGIGIDPANHDLIFEKFFQSGELALHSSGRNKFKGGGPGLGLAIARGITEAHGGQIWVESTAHDEATCPGSTFYVRLPLVASEK